MKNLPIDSYCAEIESLLEKNTRLILKASPGSGKTTRVPPFLLRSRIFQNRHILVLEPRRLAAKLAARRVCEENRFKLGKEVGYQFRFEKVLGAETRLRFLTEGTFVRQLMGDPELRNVGCVILDEFHERHLHTDIALACILNLQKSSRPDLRLIVTSATLDETKLRAHLEPCAELWVEAKRYPVETFYLEKPSEKPPEDLVADRVRNLFPRTEGHLLVFLPGMREIRRTEEKLTKVLDRKSARICPLHGELSREEQDAALADSAVPKIILSTNIAESSLTIDGIDTVLDSGLHRQASFSWWLGLPALTTKKISKASAEQRAGRAGRTQAGRCFRLYTQSDFAGRPSFDLPELKRTDLAQTLLELKAMGIPDLFALPWFDPPESEPIRQATDFLVALGALNLKAELTETGRKMAELPLPPRLARFYLEACEHAIGASALVFSSLISEGAFRRQDAIQELLGLSSLDPNAKKLLSLFQRNEDWRKFDEEALQRSLLAGFPDRVCRKRASQKAGALDLVLSSGDSAIVDRSPLTESGDYFIAIAARENKHGTRRTVHIDSLVPIEENWLFDIKPSPIHESAEFRWNPKLERVEESSSLLYGKLELTTSSGPAKPGARAFEVLVSNVLGTSREKLENQSETEWEQCFENHGLSDSVSIFLGRWDVMRQHPDLFPAIPTDWAHARKRLLEKLEHLVSRRELEQVDWHFLACEISGLDPHRFSQLLPERFDFPNGRKSKIHYRLGSKPKLASRLQDFFGVKKNPSIVSGRVPLLLELLAPNQRAVQVTQDLEGFWKKAYQELRSQLMRRYPRHSWPEDPSRVET